MGGSVASVATQRLTSEVDFALIGHQESWRAAADVLAVLRDRNILHCLTMRSRTFFPGFRPESSAMSKPVRSQARRRTVSTSIPSSA